jgi:hypothetical protein
MIVVPESGSGRELPSGGMDECLLSLGDSPKAVGPLP